MDNIFEVLSPVPLMSLITILPVIYFVVRINLRSNLKDCHIWYSPTVGSKKNKVFIASVKGKECLGTHITYSKKEKELNELKTKCGVDDFQYVGVGSFVRDMVSKVDTTKIKSD